MKDTKKKILIIDDDRDLCKTISIWLETSRFIPYEANNGRKGWETIKRELPDLIILDLTMPGLDGFDILKFVRSNQDTNHIPIVVLTGKDTMGEVEKAFASGANDYIKKPFDWWRLYTKICSLLNIPESEKSNIIA